jgi:hypothetical protein
VGACVVAARPGRFCSHVAKRAATSGRALGSEAETCSRQAARGESEDGHSRRSSFRVDQCAVEAGTPMTVADANR